MQCRRKRHRDGRARWDVVVLSMQQRMLRWRQREWRSGHERRRLAPRVPVWSVAVAGKSCWQLHCSTGAWFAQAAADVRWQCGAAAPCICRISWLLGVLLTQRECEAGMTDAFVALYTLSIQCPSCLPILTNRRSYYFQRGLDVVHVDCMPFEPHMSHHQVCGALTPKCNCPHSVSVGISDGECHCQRQTVTKIGDDLDPLTRWTDQTSPLDLQTSLPTVSSTYISTHNEPEMVRW
jgi:hypothetical protein